VISTAVYRPDGTLLWLPATIAKRIGARRRSLLSDRQLNDSEVAALIASRVAANAAGQHCDAAWHRKNGYA